MKIWSASNRGFALALLAALGVAGPAHGATVEAVMTCLNAIDLPCAEAALVELRADGEDHRVHELAAHIAFHRGDYEQAVRHVELALEAEPELEGEYEQVLSHYRATLDATAGMVELREGDVILRHAPGMDAILVDEAMQTLEAAQRTLRQQLGALPPQPILVEIFPTGKRFVAASGLPQESVSTTGVVAISKWARLLMTSPRAVARGYGWKDTLVHEYVHQVVSHLSHDRTPVWLHEGIARYLETCWRHQLNAPLEPFSQAALARALAADDLVTFEEMHPSFAFLPSAERGAVAYAQVQILVATAAEHGGEGTIGRCLAAIDGGAEAPAALAAAAGYPDFDALFDDAVAAMRGLELVERKLAALPLTIDGEGGDFAEDPLLAADVALADHARLGDLLRLADRPRAALVEYGKAMPPDEPPSPLLSNRSAECHLLLGDEARALELLRSATQDYPSFAMTWKGLGQLERQRGELQVALDAYLASADVYPFDSEVQAALAALYIELGDPVAAARHARFERVLLHGGEDLGGAVR
jgi:tetratricopeptide (TPR) repeat protein